MDTLVVPIDTRGKCDWSGLRFHRDAVRTIVRAFSQFLAASGQTVPIERIADDCQLLWEEACEVAEIANVRVEDIVAANVFYDMASSRCACTAFAVEGERGPMHGHCLDWECGADFLREHAMLFRFVSMKDDAAFTSTGWPGFLGVIVGTAPRRFSVTVNAVWSTDARERGEPLGMVLRKAFATRRDYNDLVAFVTTCKLACDCLLLVTGVRRGEMTVVERTPRRAALREAANGLLLVTNHYNRIPAGLSVSGYLNTGDEPFGLGTHDRYRKTTERLKAHQPHTLEDCFDLLGQEPFWHDMTIQRIALSAGCDRLLVSSVASSLYGTRSNSGKQSV